MTISLHDILKVAFLSVAIAGYAITDVNAQKEVLPKILLGAWIQSTDECKQTFTRRRNGWSFAKSASQFDPAFIIEKGQILSPYQTCRIINSSSIKNRIMISLDCRSDVSFLRVNAHVEIIDGNQIIYGFKGNSALNQTYRKCKNFSDP